MTIISRPTVVKTFSFAKSFIFYYWFGRYLWIAHTFITEITLILKLFDVSGSTRSKLETLSSFHSPLGVPNGLIWSFEVVVHLAERLWRFIISTSLIQDGKKEDAPCCPWQPLRSNTYRVAPGNRCTLFSWSIPTRRSSRLPNRNQQSFTWQKTWTNCKYIPTLS